MKSKSRKKTVPPLPNSKIDAIRVETLVIDRKTATLSESAGNADINNGAMPGFEAKQGASAAVVSAKKLTLLHHERTFLQYQRDLKLAGTHVLNEAMTVLDIIDVKTQSLLSYIAISLTALVFLITSLPNTSNLKLILFGEHFLTASLLVLILALLGASILCLTCLNIVGAHTIRRLVTSRKQATQQEYEDLIVKVTLGRRNRYLLAHRISVATAVLTFILFVLLLIGSLSSSALSQTDPSLITRLQGAYIE